MNIKTLLPELRKLVTDLAEDLLARATSDAKIDAGLRDAFHQIEKGGRTAQAFEVWREDYLDQVAVAWVLACVFVRFMEDNQLIDECWLAGEGERRGLAEDTHELFFREHPHDTDREYFQHVFKEVGKIPAAKDLFAEGKTPLWAVAPSGDAAIHLLKFWREIDAESGHLKRSFQVENGDTRLLGDLYQELSERAKKKYALLQTPVFVEEFILDRTLTPALDEFGLEKVRMIDPTCGSGHFLLGGFARLFDLWIKRESNEIVAAQKALDGIWGVDINPFAVAIARFRLIVAAVQACGIKRLKQTPAWNIHLATGDSLLFGSRWNRTGDEVLEQGWLASNEESWAPDIYACEDKEGIQEVLCQQYHVVVGNPPYIIVRDRTLNAAYRERYSTCHQKYSLAVPFTERFFDLCLTGRAGKSGYVGMITANSFMKRVFGEKLIEEFFPKIDLTHVLDTSGMRINGHGTPTVILLGRNRKPVSDTVRAVLGIKGDPPSVEDASQGFVWRSILQHIDVANAHDDYTSSVDVPRATFNAHPWSIGGGGAAELKERLDEAGSQTIGDLVDSIGIVSVTGEDDLYVFPRIQDAERLGVQHSYSLVLGDMIRDYCMAAPVTALWPYNKRFQLRDESELPDLIRVLWPCKTSISLRRRFGTPMVLKGAKWYEWQELYDDKLLTPYSIVFAFVATHNHFVLDRGGKVFKQSAPIIKLSADATENDHVALFGLLNSSVGCFWTKQSFHDKGGGGIGGGIAQEFWEHFFEFTATGLQSFPLPEGRSLKLSRKMDDIARQYASLLPGAVAQTVTPTCECITKSRNEVASIRGQMIALQEELDWHCYQLYGLAADDLRYTGDDLPELVLGQRAFEIVMARQMAHGELESTWFERHGSTPITEIPTHWPDAYRKLVERRIKLIETNKGIALIEKPEYKRRWNSEPWEEQEQRALKNWLLDRVETPKYRKGTKDNPELTTTAQMADVASADAEFLQVAALYRGRPDFNVTALVAELVEGEAVPFLPILRYKPSGLRKREIWERTWELQREEDRDQTTKHTKHTKEDEEIQTASDSSDLFSVFRVFRGSTSGGSTSDGGSISGGSTSDGSSASGGSTSDGGSASGGSTSDGGSASGGSTSDGGSIPVPPKYTSADFLKTDFWRLRGKLDVPKERWISYPHCSTDGDPTLVVGWAGWNHLEQATALVAYYDARKREGWDAKRLAPLLAGLDQLLPWIHQWHPEIDAEFGETAGQSFQTVLEQDAHELGLTLDDVRQWTPPEKQRKMPAARKKKAK